MARWPARYLRVANQRRWPAGWVAPLARCRYPAALGPLLAVRYAYPLAMHHTLMREASERNVVHGQRICIADR